MLGAEPIVSYDSDVTNRAKLCRAFYPTTRDATLRAYPWSFAIERKSLSADPTAPIFGSEKKFGLPANPWCLRVLGLDDEDIDWRVEGRFLVCDNTTVMIKYIARIENTTLYDSLFVQAFATRMAAILSKPITGSSDVSLWQLYASMVQEAQTVDGMEGTLPKWESNELVDVRY
jgi:hypothetical protein